MRPYLLCGLTLAALVLPLTASASVQRRVAAASRAERLGSKGYLFASFRDRYDLVTSGQAHAADLQTLGELALALNRLEPMATVASELQRRGTSMAAWPASLRAALAAYEMRQGRAARAAEILPDTGSLARIPSDEARTRALMVAASVRAAQNRLPEAVEILGALTGGNSNASAFARVQRARLLYEMNRHTEALEELSFVPKTSPQWYSGLIVAAWSAYKLKDDNLTLGQTMSLTSPHLAGKFNPESYILESASLFRLCHYESAQRSLARLRNAYRNFPGVIGRFRQAYGNRYAGVAAVLGYVHGKSGPASGFSDREWDMLVDGLLATEAMSDADRMLIQIEREEAGMGSSGMKSGYRAEFDAAKREAYAYALGAMNRRLTEMNQDVQRSLEGSLAVEVEINTRIRERLLTRTSARMKDVDFQAEVRKGYEFWPFEGEYWRDEVGGYAFATTDVCSNAPASGVDAL
ncbi:MAG: hypothetical protein JST16_13140 [Bdellovibrionales bacterium]|nr:hypothetical protein [Bdellovibrionales bacterium]